jgi:hypothetical protein
MTSKKPTINQRAFFFVFFCFCRFHKEKARKEIVMSPQKGKNWTITEVRGRYGFRVPREN